MSAAPALDPTVRLTPHEPLPLLRRKDLTWTCRTVGGELEWIVKDPLAQAYFRFDEPEFAALQMLDGKITPRRLLKRLDAEFPARGMTGDELQELVAHAVRQQLVTVERPHEGPRLRQTADRMRLRERLTPLLNPFWIKLPLWDPDAFLTNLLPWCRWVLSPWALAAAVLFCLTALAGATVHFAELSARLPSAEAFFTSDHLGWLVVAWIVSKSLHELGHGLLCKHFGGEVHEMGVILVGGLPCMYCNVTDSWLLDKYRRAAIGAAGMAVELVLAAAAFWGWWFSVPGAIHFVCLQTVVVCSVGTLLFNANPLLRYDGYYILSDLLEIPNLRTKAQSALRAWTLHLAFGWTIPLDGVTAAARPWFAAYAAVSFAYRWILLYCLLNLLEQLGEPYRLEVVGRAAGLFMISATVVLPLVWGLWTLVRAKERQPVNFLRLSLFAACLGGLGWVCCAVPFPQRTEAPFVIEPTGRSVFVTVSGTLDEIHVLPGQVVKMGDVLAKLSNPVLELELIRLDAQLKSQSRRLAQLDRERHRSPEAAAQLPAARQMLNDLTNQLNERRRDAEQLVLKAPQAGTVLPPPLVRRTKSPGELPTWDDTPLAPRNLGCLLESGTLLCRIGPPREFEAVPAVDQADVETLRTGLPVRLLLDGLPDVELRGRIAAIAGQEMQSVPPQLSKKSGGRLATETGPDGRERPQAAHYQVRIPLDDPAGLLKPGLRGRALISVGERTWLEWLVRSFHQTFNFRR